MRTKIDIDTRTFVRFWLVIFGIALAAYLLYQAQVALIILGISVFLALALNAPVARIAKRLPGRSRVAATAIAYLAVVTVIGAIIFLVIPPIVQQTAQFAERAPSLVQQATDQWQGLRDFLERYNLQSQLDVALQSVQSSAAGWTANVGQTVVGGIGSFFSFIAALILVLVLTFLILIEGPEWMKRVWSLYRDQSLMKQHRRVAGRIYTVVSGYVSGQLIVSSIGATAAGLFVFLLSLIFPEVPSNLAMPTAAVTFLLSLVPMFGATIGGIIVTLLLAFNNIPAAIIYAIYFVVYQQIENNFIAPHIQSKRIDLSALMVLAAVTIGLYMFGIIGGIIAIPIAGSIRILVDEYLAHKKQTEKASSSKKA
ncbi:AI-2E family transporter [Candidatus Saccharibacteria bacterium]|nr:AI-2E family transporter [Candidatus Saccharibacteria bacterium]